MVDEQLPLIVQSDLTLLLEVQSSLFEQTRQAIAPFAEIVKSPEYIHTYQITANLVMNLAACAREIFESSEADEKRQLLDLVFQNLQLKDGSLLVSVREPFLTMLDFKNRPGEWRRWDSNPRNVFTFTRFPSVLHRPLGHSSKTHKSGQLIETKVTPLIVYSQGTLQKWRVVVFCSVLNTRFL